MKHADQVCLDERRLHRDLERLERRYNPTKTNLHFCPLDHVDADLYPSLAALARRGVAAECRRRRHHARWPGDHDFWYDLFLMVSAAAGTFDPKQHAAFVHRRDLHALVDALVDAAEFTLAWAPGDVWKRHHEALGDTLLFIRDDGLVNRVRARARRRAEGVRQFATFTIARAEQVRLERHSSPPGGGDHFSATAPAPVIGAHAVIGRRPRMEDRHVVAHDAGGYLAAVMDGHGGSVAAERAADQLPSRLFAALASGLDARPAFRRAFADLDAAIRFPDCGTTVTACYVRGQTLTVAHVGDGRVVLVGPREARALTRDHRVDNRAERRRILAAGGRVQGHYVMRDGRGLMVTRALGDTAFRPAGVIARPEILTRQVTTPGAQLVLATDGIWDVIDIATAARVVRTTPDPSSAARALVAAAERAGARDNLTAVVISVPAAGPLAVRTQEG